MRIVIPQGLQAQRVLGADWSNWIDRLPGLAREVLEEWQLRLDGESLHGYCSLVLPVRTKAGQRAALKITVDADTESEHEPLALQRWAGRGAVQLLRADPHRRALLLEWLLGPDLGETWDLEACEEVAKLYRLLHIPAPPQVRTVNSFLPRWLDDLAANARDLPVPRRYVEQALSLGRDLLSDPASTGRLIHGDLHYANVLRGTPRRASKVRTPWVAIDPKPMNGDPHYEPAPMLLNRWPGDATDIRTALRARFHTLVDVADLDEERARYWVIVRMILNANWSLQDARAADRALSVEDRDWITRCITIAKAVQD